MTNFSSATSPNPAIGDPFPEPARGGPPRGASGNARRLIIAEAASSGHPG
jgi:hypothetical protein